MTCVNTGLLNDPIYSSITKDLIVSCMGFFFAINKHLMFKNWRGGGGVIRPTIGSPFH